ncbi:MAG: hypothetical protein L3J73_01910 [Thermoplasmata archaeon]|nr:hypothetical protein [Thermoplasmata archaeon]
MRARRVALLCGIFAGLLLLLAALLTLLGGLVDVAFGHLAVRGVLATAGTFLVEGVLGFLMIVFAAIGSRRSADVVVASGVALVLLALVTWVFVGVSALLLLGGLLALLSGIFLLIGRA